MREERETVQAFRDSLEHGESGSGAAARSVRCAGLYAYLQGDADSAVAIFSRLEAARDPRAEPDPIVEAALGVMYLFREEPARGDPRLREACRVFPDVGFLDTRLRAYVPPSSEPALPERDSTALEDLALAELREALEVEDEARWAKIGR